MFLNMQKNCNIRKLFIGYFFPKLFGLGDWLKWPYTTFRTKDTFNIIYIMLTKQNSAELSYTFNMESTKEQLIADIENLLNRYDEIKPTHINPDLLQFLDRQTLLSIINSILRQQEKTNESNIEWLEQFKQY